MSENYERPQRIPRMGYETPQHRITWTLDKEAVQVISRFEENIKARGNP